MFPLPDVVLFPHVRLPLHVFELRYRQLVRDALAGEREIAIATLKPGWEQDYAGSPAFHELACVGRFEQVQWRTDDCYDLVLTGVRRVRLGAVRQEFPYRACASEDLPEQPHEGGDPLAEMERHALLAELRRLLPFGAQAWRTSPGAAPDAGLETLVNAMAHALRIETSARLELLALDSVLDRAQRLHSHLRHIRLAPPSEGDAFERN
ncbi:MAG TPA: LON peptidase substrate-binding domain-containing protein [Candidatus Acidoferrales bacterium]|nr:LON peptidase substrate-binding domain-containing protein [Candidatus Acidoferrales bacterium]